MDNTSSYSAIIGLLILVLGYFGYSDVITSGQVSQLINSVSQVIGILLAIYGSYQNHKTIGRLGAIISKTQ